MKNKQKEHVMKKDIFVKRNFSRHKLVYLLVGIILITAVILLVSRFKLSHNKNEDMSRLLLSKKNNQYSQGWKIGEEMLKKYPDDSKITRLTVDLYVADWELTRNQKLFERAEILMENYLHKNQNQTTFKDILLLTRIKKNLLEFDEAILLLKDAQIRFPLEIGHTMIIIGSLYDFRANPEYADIDKAKYYYGVMAGENSSHTIIAYYYLSRLGLYDNNITSIRENALKLIKITSEENDSIMMATGYANLALSYHLEENNPKAVGLANKSISTYPFCGLCYHILADVLLEDHIGNKTVFHKKNLDLAIEAVNKGNSLLKESNGYYLLGVSYWLKGEKDKAMQTWQEGLNLLKNDDHNPRWLRLDVEKKLNYAIANPEGILYGD